MKALQTTILAIALFFPSFACAQETFVYDDHDKRDPFWPLVSPSGAIITYDNDFLITDLQLEGIVTGQQNDDIAIINGRVLKVNDLFGVYIISEIKEDSVILKKGNQKFELKLKKEE